MSLLFTEASSNELVSALISVISSGAPTSKPYIEIYAGTRPCNTSTTNGDNLLLATILLNENPFTIPSAGIAIANSSTPQSNIPVGGVATWFRMYNRDAEVVLDGDITGPAGDVKPSCSGGQSRGFIDGDLIFDLPQFFKGNLIGLEILALTTPAIN